MSDTLYVLAASYDHVEDALAEYQAIEAAYRHVGSSHDFDATVIAKDEAGKVDIVRRHDEGKRHNAEVGATWGLAAGAVAALFPAVGILGALAVGGGAGAAIGALTGHTTAGMSRADLMALGEVLDDGDAGVVVVYASDMADRVGAAVTRARRTTRATTRLTAEQLAAKIGAAGDPAARS
jgi:uncharacterized membrane protein